MSIPIRELSRSNGKSVTVVLKNQTSYSGRLHLSDEHMNLIIADCSEIRSSNEEGEEKQQVIRLGKVFLRGNNIAYIVIR
ncbi:MAG: LSM domain-containing protein [Candidatus Heimdallarchaeota archaeon]